MGFVCAVVKRIAVAKVNSVCPVCPDMGFVCAVVKRIAKPRISSAAKNT